MPLCSLDIGGITGPAFHRLSPMAAHRNNVIGKKRHARSLHAFRQAYGIGAARAIDASRTLNFKTRHYRMLAALDRRHNAGSLPPVNTLGRGETKRATAAHDGS